jgi:hypothetical protein
MYREVGDMIPLRDVEAICAMILSGEVESFFDMYDQMVPMERKTTARFTEGRFGQIRVPEPPGGWYREKMHKPKVDNLGDPPTSGSGVMEAPVQKIMVINWPDRFGGTCETRPIQERPDIPSSQPTKLG